MSKWLKITIGTVAVILVLLFLIQGLLIAFGPRM